MKHPHNRFFGRLLGIVLAFSILLAPAAQALTASQLKLLLNEHYLDEVSDAVLSEETIEGILKALDDPYTEYLTAEEYQMLLSSLEDQEIGGIGVSALAVDEGLLITEVHKNSPAMSAGLAAGDIITSVSGNAAAGQTAEVITSWLRGEIGAKVTIQVLHTDGRYAEYTLVRQLVVIPATTYEQITDSVCYINCKTFGSSTLTHFLEAMEECKGSQIWMVDLRTNLGGDVNAVSQTLGVFMGKGSVAYLRNGDDQYLLYASQQESKTIMPTIVLTSPFTASAAEIFSGVIRDKEMGLLVGERTYGKGVAQILLDAASYPLFFADGDAMKITAYRYFTTSGTTADQVGIIPHLMVSAFDAADIAMLLTEQEPKGNDRSDYLRLHLGGWRWYLDLKNAASADNSEYFTMLLEALPPGTAIYQGTKSGDWTATTVESLVGTYQLSDYDARGFTDVSGSGYEKEINTLATYGILLGNGDGSFNPGGSMTRAELCAILTQALGLGSGREGSSFKDVSEDAWYVEEVNAVCSAGLMEGVGDGNFNPEGTVSEEQLITVMARMGTVLSAYLYEDAKTWDPETAQVPNTYSEWAQKWVWLLSQSQKDILGETVNLLFDSPNRIRAQGDASRGEAAALLYNILEHIRCLPV